MTKEPKPWDVIAAERLSEDERAEIRAETMQGSTPLLEVSIERAREAYALLSKLEDWIANQYNCTPSDDTLERLRKMHALLPWNDKEPISESADSEPKQSEPDSHELVPMLDENGDEWRKRCTRCNRMGYESEFESKRCIEVARSLRAHAWEELWQRNDEGQTVYQCRKCYECSTVGLLDDYRCPGEVRPAVERQTVELKQDWALGHRWARPLLSGKGSWALYHCGICDQQTKDPIEERFPCPGAFVANVAPNKETK